MPKLHPKIQELRSKIGHMPIMKFTMTSRDSYSTAFEKTAPSFSEEERLVKQYFCIFGIPDDYNTQPEKGCFKKSLEERGPDTSSPGKIIVLNQHRAHMPVCVPKLLQEDENGLYGEYIPDEGVAHCEELLIQIRKGTINNGSYGFNYVWDKMVYDEKKDIIHMYEVSLHEVSPVTFGSQRDTFILRKMSDGTISDEQLEYETEELIKQIPRKYHLQIRGLIAQHRSLMQFQPIEQSRKSLKQNKPKQSGLDYSYLLNNI